MKIEVDGSEVSSDSRFRVHKVFSLLFFSTKLTKQPPQITRSPSLALAPSLAGKSANLIPGSIQLKRVQKHRAEGQSDMIRVLCTMTRL